MKCGLGFEYGGGYNGKAGDINMSEGGTGKSFHCGLAGP